MRILIAHNFYRSRGPSGENNAVAVELDLLRQSGHDVELYRRDSDDLLASGIAGLVRGGLSVPWNPSAAADLVRQVRRFRPDVVHAHNTFPSISPAVFSALRGRTARVLTLHNYRLFCAQGLFTRNGTICTRCLDLSSCAPGLLHGCYRDSRIATLPLSIGIFAHKWLGTWTNEVEAFIALTQYQRDLFVRGGLPSNKLHVKPNFFALDANPKSWHERTNEVVFVGRIAAEKGVRTLVEAWTSWGAAAPVLRIIGDGPEREFLVQQARRAGLQNVRFLGSLDHAQTIAEISNARLLVIPSVGMEGLPMVIPEAFALGTPVVAADSGPLPYIVEQDVNGALFTAGCATSLRNVLTALWREPSRLQGLANGALESYRRTFTSRLNLDRLEQIYEAAIAGRVHHNAGRR